LLHEAGETTPLNVNLSVVNSPDSIRTAEVIQSMAVEAGFDVKIKAMGCASAADRSTAL
jgi:peptide/nickel transport system substrate-binding protein